MKIFFPVLILILIASCSKDENTEPTPEEKYLSWKIFVSGNDSTPFLFKVTSSKEEYHSLLVGGTSPYQYEIPVTAGHWYDVEYRDTTGQRAHKHIEVITEQDFTDTIPATIY